MHNRGYIPVEEWSRLERELKRITRKYRDYLFKFFHTNRLKDESSESFVILHDIVRDKLFTDREKVYYDMYEKISGGEV